MYSNNRLLKNGHLAAVLESPLVTSACGLTLRAPSRSNFTSEIVRRDITKPPRGFLRVRRSAHFSATWRCQQFSKWRLALVLLLCLLLAGCGDNLAPSNEDKRPVVQAGTTGPAVTQKAPDFSVSDASGANVTLAGALAGKKGIVLYFTMWCPICDSHMNSMRTTVTPSFPDVGFYLVDYVSGSVVDAARAASENGYGGGVFTTLADLGQAMLGSYQATMGTTVVIDSSGIVRMNEDYRDGQNLRGVLAALP